MDKLKEWFLNQKRPGDVGIENSYPCQMTIDTYIKKCLWDKIKSRDFQKNRKAESLTIKYLKWYLTQLFNKTIEHIRSLSMLSLSSLRRKTKWRMAYLIGMHPSNIYKRLNGISGPQCPRRQGRVHHTNKQFSDTSRVSKNSTQFWWYLEITSDPTG